MFYINEIPISSQWYKKGFMIFFTVMLRPFIKYRSPPPCFPSRNITKNAETHPPPMRDVIIEQPLRVRVIFISLLNFFQYFMSAYFLKKNHKSN